MDSEELAEHLAALSYLCDLLRTYDVTKDPIVTAIVRAARGESPKQSTVVEFPKRESH